MAGKDLLGGGTWMAIQGRHLALVTNYRDPNQPRGERSRGRLVLDYFVRPPGKFTTYLGHHRNEFTGYNLIFGHGTRLFYHSHRRTRVQSLEPGLHGLSNAELNTPWPKVERGKRLLADALQGDLEVEHLLEILRDRRRPPDADLPETGVGLVQERLLSSIFIEGPGYGSRCGTVLLQDQEGRSLIWERDYLSGATVHFLEPPEEPPHR